MMLLSEKYEKTMNGYKNLEGIASVGKTIGNIVNDWRANKLAKEQLNINKGQLERENRIEDEKIARNNKAQDAINEYGESFFNRE